ncbi:MAG: hypothetical protein AAGF90_14835 [Pseudomonadota bacterium]
MRRFLIAIFAAFVLAAPSTSFAVTTGGFFDGGGALSGPGFANGSAMAGANEDFGGLMGSLTIGNNLKTTVTATINPFQTDGSAALNTIELAFQINDDPFVEMEITPTNGTGSSIIEDLILKAGDILTFRILGVAGAAGNQVTFSAAATPHVVPLPGTLALLVSALAGVGVLSLKRREA